MQDKKIGWCFKIKDGIKIVDPNSRMSKTYLEQSKLSLLRAKKNFADDDLLWTTVTIYYAEYYALYSFLQRIGIRCENHSCSISLVGFLLENSIVNTINEHKDKRIDAQYYMRVGRQEDIGEMLREAQFFISRFDNTIANLSDEEITKYRHIILNIKEN